MALIPRVLHGKKKCYQFLVLLEDTHTQNFFKKNLVWPLFKINTYCILCVCV